MPINVLIYEDNIQFRNSLWDFLKQDESLHLVGAYSSCENIIDQTSRLQPDVILMDIELPGINGIKATYLVTEKFPFVNVMILSSFGDDENVFKAIMAGASGYILKGTEDDKVANAIQLIHNGGAPMTPSIARKTLELFKQKTNKCEKEKLTERQFKILELMKQGLSYKMVANELNIEMGTVQVHIKNIYNRLSVHSKSEAIWKVFK